MTTFELLDYLNEKGIALWVKDGKLRYRAPNGALDAGLKAEIVKHKPELLTLLRNATDNSRQPSIQPVSRNQPLPLSFAQQRLWLLSQLDPASNAVYNIPLVLQLSGPLDISALTHSLNAIIQRHEILRTTIYTENGQPLQNIAETLTLDIPLVDLGQQPAAERQAEAQRITEKLAQAPFDFSIGPLFRAKLLRLASAEHWFILVMHHIISDGWSHSIFNRELSTYYQAFSTGATPSLPALTIQYADFAVWQQVQFESGVFEPQFTYWKKQLAGDLPVLELPTDRPRPPVKTFRGAMHTFTIPPDTVEAVKAISQQEKATPFMILLAAFKILLYRYTQQEDILVGTPIANRTQAEIEPLIGFFVNTLVLRSDLSGHPTFRDLLACVRQVTLEAYAHQDLPFEKLVEIIQPERTTSHTPLFQVMFTLQNTPPATIDLAGLTVSPLQVESDSAKFDLALILTDEQGVLSGHVRYNTDLFDAPTIERLAAHFNTLLAAAVTSPERSIAHLPLLTATEQRLLSDWNDTQAGYPANACIHHLFEAQVERTPDAIAVRFGEAHLTYRDLNQRANQLAHYLQSLGVGPEALAGLCVERSPEMIIGLLAILKAGGAYTPLDPAYPPERLAFMLADTQAAVLLTQTHLRDRFPDYKGQLIYLDDAPDDVQAQANTNPASTATAANLAYIIYTSGSTGQPKGVMIEHRALVNFTEIIVATYDISAADRVLQFASISFDASAEEIYPALTRGATLILRTEEMLASGDTFWQRCDELGLTVLDLPTAYWHQLVSDLPKLKQPFPESLRLVILGGEQAMAEAVNVWLEHTPPAVRLVNSYGPTEATVVATVYEVTRHNLSHNVPIGRPIGNIQAYILDEQLQPVPVGVPGELHLSGVGVARGYLNRPELTADRFIDLQFTIDHFGLASKSNVNNSQLYKTGDLVRYRPDGNIEFLGRIDNQVKIRGFRIELGEIETVLNQHPAVEQSVVIVREDTPGDKRLVAYVTSHQLSGDSYQLSVNSYQSTVNQSLITDYRSLISDLRRYLKAHLPDYMIPSAFVILDQVPLNTNGKVDRQALPAPEATRLDLDDDFAAPRTPHEKTMARLWADILGIAQIGLHDNFFEVGGHSLLAVRLIAAIEEATGKKIPATALFQAPTVAQLTEVVYAEDETTSATNALVALRTTGSQSPLFCMPGNLGNVFTDLNYLVKHLPADLPVYAFQDSADIPSKIEEIAGYYLDQLRTAQKEGPYFIAGICSGAIIAYEMAQQLQVQQQTVALLALIEPSPPPAGTVQSHLRFVRYMFPRVMQRFSHHSDNLTNLSAGEQKDYLRLKMKVVTNAWAVRRYKPQVYAGHIDLFMTETSLNSPANRQTQWRDFALAGAKIHQIPGTHDTITGNNDAPIEEDHMRVLAEKLTACIEQIRR